MVKIRVFIPHLELKEIFENVVDELPSYDNVQIETTYIFGTPDVLSQNWDADILVARGMTHDVLRDMFPDKHVVQIQLSSFDIFDALVQCRKLQAKKIALCLHNVEIHNLDSLQELCGASIRMYDVADEQSAEAAVCEAASEGADTFVGAGTMCGICDRRGLRRVHIHTKHDAVVAAMQEALNAAKTINLERTRSEIINIMLNHNEDGIIAIDDKGRILAINNQAYRVFQLSTVGELIGQPLSSVGASGEWKQLLENGSGKDQIICLHDKKYWC